MIPSSGCPPWPPDHPRTLPRTGTPTPPRGARPTLPAVLPTGTNSGAGCVCAISAGQIWLGASGSVVHRRVDDARGGLGHAATLRFPSPLIKPDVRISRIRLSDWFHRAAHGGAPSAERAAEAVGDGRRAQQHRSASVFAAG